ncbi:MAG: hypothetical protein U0133_22325 [Gemmatimonadales bacterium]
MTDSAAYYLQPLSWHQTGSRPERYELRAIPGVIADLTFRHKHEATARSPDAAWRFLSKGIFRKSADILLDPSGKVLGSCRLGYWSSHGSLELRPGFTLAFAADTWDKSYSVRAPSGALVFSYDFRGFFSLRSPLTWGEFPEPAEDFPWLIPFAWFLAVRYYRDVIEAAGAVVAAG